MDDAVEIKEKNYQIGGSEYRLEPLSWQQNKWLADHIFKDIDMQRLDYAAVHDLLRERGPLFMAISLIDAAHTRAEHSRLSFKSIQDRAEVFAGELTGGEVALFGPHFFRYCRPDQMAMLIPGKVLQAEFQKLAEAAQAEAAPSHAPGGSGSSGASSRSVEETLHEFLSSSPNGGPPSPSPISGAASSETSSTAPSLAGSV